MSITDANLVEIYRYLEIMPVLRGICWQSYKPYTDIITNILTGEISNGCAWGDKRTEIEIDFVTALIGIPSAERFFHSHGIVMEKFHFYCNRNSRTVPEKFDLSDSQFPLPLVFRSCTFDETLDLRRARLASLDLTRSTLPALMLQGARIDGRLILDETHLTFGRWDENLPLEPSQKNFLEAVKNREVGMPRAGLDANDLVTGDRVSLKNSLVRGGIRLRHASIGGDFVAKKASIISRRYADAMCLKSKVQCKRCLTTLREKLVDVEHKSLKINKNKDGWEEVKKEFNTECARQSVESIPRYNPDELAFDALHLHEAHIDGAVELTDGFISVGEVSLNSARVDGGVYCRGGTFFQHDGVALSMDGIKAGGSIYFDEYLDHNPSTTGDPTPFVPFVAHGTVSMRGATIDHRLVITKAYFLKQSINSGDGTWPPRDPLKEREGYAFFAKRLKVAGDMFFNKDASGATTSDNKYHVSGAICLENADIGGRLFLAAKPDPADPSNDVFLDLSFVRVAGSAHLQILPIRPVAKASLKSARVGSLDVSACAHQWVSWDLEGLHYDAIEKVDEVTPEGNAGFNPKWVSVWTDEILRKREEINAVLQKSRPLRNVATVAIQPFDALMAFLRESGQDEAACDVGIAKEQTITDNIKLMRNKGLQCKKQLTKELYLFWRWIIDFLVSYGYRTEKALLFLIFLIFIGTMVFDYAYDSEAIFETKLNYYIREEQSSPIKAQEYPHFVSVLYSFEVATPILDLGQESHFDIKGTRIGYEIYKWFHTFAGWFLSILIVLSPTKLLRRE